MPDETLILTDPRDTTRKLRITVTGGVYPTDDEVFQMFDSKFGVAKPEAKPRVPQAIPKPTEPPTAPKKPVADVAPKPQPVATPTFQPPRQSGLLPIPSMSLSTLAGAQPPAQKKQPQFGLPPTGRISELTTLTPAERTRLQASISPKERFNLDVTDYINTWLSGRRPESLAFQKFVDYATAPNETERQRRMAGISPVGQAAFKRYYGSMSEANKQRIAELRRMQEQSVDYSAAFMDPSGQGIGLTISPALVEEASRKSASAATALRTGQPFEQALPLGFDPRGALLPRAEAGAVTSGGQNIRSQVSDILRPDTLAVIALGHVALKPVLGAATSPLASRAFKVAFGLANIPMVMGAIEQGDPEVIMSSGLVAFLPDILSLAVPKGVQYNNLRRMKSILSERIREYDKQYPGRRQMLAKEMNPNVRAAFAAQEGATEMPVPETIPVPEGATAATLLDERLNTASASVKAGRFGTGINGAVPEEPVVAPRVEPVGVPEPTAAPTVTGAPETVTPPAPTGIPETVATPPVPPSIREVPVTGGSGAAPGGSTLTIAAQERIESVLAELYGSATRADDVRLTPAQREANLNNWRRGATQAVADADRIYSEHIEPYTTGKRPDYDAMVSSIEGAGGNAGQIRVAAAAKQAEILTQAIELMDTDPQNTQVAELLRQGNNLSRVITESGSRAGLELAMTRWFDLTNIDWSSDDAAMRVARLATRLGAGDPASVKAVVDVANGVKRRVRATHAAQDAAAEASAVRPKGAPGPKAQARRTAQRAARTVRDLGPSQDDFEAALARLRASSGRINAGVDPMALRDAVIVGTYHFKNGLADFILWSDKMVQTLGEQYRPYLQGVWDKVSERSSVGFDVPKTRVMTLFSGGGIFEQGIANNSVDFVGAVELDPRIAAHYRSVYGDHVINDGVQNVDYTQFRGKVDHLHASPVCKAFCGIRGAREVQPIDMQMAQATARAIRDIQPTSVSIENAPEYANTPEFKVIVDELERSGYRYDIGVYDAADYGTPQHRKRLILRAWNLDQDLPAVVKTHGPTTDQPYAGWMDSVQDLLGGAQRSDIPPYYKRRLGVESVGQLGLTSPTLVEAVPGGPRAPRLFNAGEPSNTLFTGSGGRVSRVIVPSDRGTEVVDLPIRGVARLMGLPDSYTLPENKTLAQTVIGNGVTPQIASATVGPMIDAIAMHGARGGARGVAPSMDDVRAAMDRIVKKVSSGAMSSIPGAPPPIPMDDLIIVIRGLFAAAKDATGRKFSSVAQQVRDLIPDVSISDAMLQQAWLQMRHQNNIAKKIRSTDPELFVTQLAQMLKGRAAAVQFLNGLQDEDGTPTILQKLLDGTSLTDTERQRLNDAWNAVSPRKSGMTPEQLSQREGTPAARLRRARQEVQEAERALRQAEKQRSVGTLENVRQAVDKRLDDLATLPSGLTGQKSKLIDQEAARYRANANAFAAHIRAVIRKAGNADPEEISRAVATAVEAFKKAPADLVGAKNDFSAAIDALKPATTRMDDVASLMRSRYGQARAQAILDAIPEDIRIKWANGETLTSSERSLIAQAYMDNPAPPRQAKPKTAAGLALEEMSESVKEAKRVAREIAREAASGADDFTSALTKKFGRKRTEEILRQVEPDGLKDKVDSGEELNEDESQLLANAIDATRPQPRVTPPKEPTFAEKQVLIAHERARGMSDLRYAAEGKPKREKVDLKQYLPEAVVEFRKSARSLMRFREAVEKKYPNLFTAEEINDLFMDAARKYADETSTVEAQKAQIATIIRQRLRAERSTASKFLEGLGQYNNIFRAIALGQDLGVLFTQGAFMTLARPGALYAGLPSANDPNKLQKIERFVTGMAGNRRSASTMAAMLQSWGSEAKVGEFAAEASALQSQLHGDPDFYEKIGLAIERVGELDTMQSRLDRIETYRGMEALEDIPGLGKLYSKTYFPNVGGGINPKSVMNRFERSTAVGLNRMRIAMFETLMARHRDLTGDSYEAAAKLVAEQVNLMTGRAPFTPQQRIALANVAQALTAPEFYASRATMASGFGPFAISGKRVLNDAVLKQLPAKKRVQLATTMGNEYARAFISYQLQKTILQKAGIEVEDDPFSSEFGSAKMPTTTGGYRPVDISGGIGPWFALFSQMAGFTVDTATGKYKQTDYGTRLFNFIKGKSTTIPQTIMSVGMPTNVVAELPKFKKPTAADVGQAWLNAPRTAPGGTAYSLKDFESTAKALGGSMFPASMFARSFLQSLMLNAGAGLTKEQQFKAAMEALAAGATSGVGIQVGALRPKEDRAKSIARMRRAKFLTPMEKQMRERRAIYTGRTQ